MNIFGRSGYTLGAPDLDLPWEAINIPWNFVNNCKMRKM